MNRISSYLLKLTVVGLLAVLIPITLESVFGWHDIPGMGLITSLGAYVGVASLTLAILSEAIERLLKHPLSAKTKDLPDVSPQSDVSAPFHCSFCGDALTYEPQLRRWYCPTCGRMPDAGPQ